MYERFYGVGERPFTLLPDPEFLFLSDKHQAALDMLEMAISSHSGFCVVSGEIGAGKTTLIREILNRLDDSVRVGLVSNTHPSFGELLQWTMAAFGLPCGTSDKLELHKRFVDFVIQQYAENKHTLLIIDEAQNLTPSSLEELRMLSNVNSEKDLVLQVILVGQQQLREKLADPALEQFAQRIALDYHLEGLSRAEVRQYIQHRLRHAGGNPELFSEAACAAVYQLSAGIPRLINRLCDLCLVYGCTEERLSIDAELVNRVAEDQRMGRLLSCQENVQTAPVAKELREPESTGGESVASAGSVNDMHSALLAEQDSGASSPPEESLATDTNTELHKLVVNAEKQQQSAKGERGALWLLAGVVAMVGIAGWMSRELWIDEDMLSAESGPVAEFVRNLIQHSPVDTIESTSVEAIENSTQGKAELEREAELPRKAEHLARLQNEARQIEQLEQEEAKQLELEHKVRQEQQRYQRR